MPPTDLRDTINQPPRSLARRQLPDLTKSGMPDSGGRHESSEDRTVWTQDHRHVPGEIHSADGVGIIVNVGGMQAGFTAVFPCPDWPRPDETNPRTVGVMVDFPRGREKHFDVAGREKIGFAMRAVQDADFPFRCISRDKLGMCFSCDSGLPVTFGNRKNIPSTQNAARVAAKSA